MIEQLKSLPRTVWLLGLISLVNDSASDMIYPLVPLYLSSVLMAGPKALGLIEGIAESIGSILKLVAGVLADRTHKVKYWIVAGYGIAGLARPLIAFATSWTGVLMCRIADRIGKGRAHRSARRAAEPERRSSQRGLAFGFHRAMDNLGAVSDRCWPQDCCAWACRCITCCSARGAGNRRHRAVVVRARAERPVAIKPTAFSWNLSEFPPAFRRYLWCSRCSCSATRRTCSCCCGARELGLSETEVPMLWALVSFVAAVFSTPLSALSDRIGRDG
jgi:nitrate/nitrite transporter NarK